MDFQVDGALCVRCGACVADCPVHILKKDEQGFPFVNAERAAECMDCHHCLAVCPRAALSVNGKKPSNSMQNKVRPSFEEMRLLIQNRRTCRRYKQQNVPKEKIDALLEAAAFAPTGVNARGLSLAVIDDIEVMNRFRKTVIEAIRLEAQKGLPEHFARFAKMPEQFDKGNDILFRTAPHMIAVSCLKDAPCADIDPVIALSYIELTAQTLGLGTTWCGLAYWALSAVVPRMCTCLKIPGGHELKYVMLFGEPDVRYFRSAQRDALPLTRIDI